MPDIIWWLQLVGGALTILLAAGAILTGLYTAARDTPNFVKRLTGIKSIENKFDQLHSDQLVSQQLQLQQAEAFNELSEVVCDQHDIHESGRPTTMNTEVIRRELMNRDDPDFTRGG